MSTFTLPNTVPPVEITLPEGLSKEQLLKFPAFKDWLSNLQHNLALQDHEDHAFHSNRYELRSIEVNSFVMFGDNPGFIKIQATVQNADDDGGLPGTVFLRGGSVAMLIILQPDDVPEGTEEDKYVILTVQPRIAAGSLAFPELPAGMLDGNGNFKGKAAKEIDEEVGISIPEEQLVDMTDDALKSTNISGLWRKPESKSDPMDGIKEQLWSAMYPSPGACDEFIRLYLHQKRLPRSSMEKLKGKQTGLRAEGEKITIKLVRLEDLWKEAGRDAKALAALALYEGLRRETRLPAMYHS
ncbi:nudix hydrolase 14 [Lophiotrema nucula]|uniref:Nudix hydrolase 14 n=1 Tax=Lophiotrema nucula TaxID=690887 RepID=A0A6A5YZL4_9PLEO|nr:nudix hydrolase 14 [Lophiotrema nucula]